MFEFKLNCAICIHLYSLPLNLNQDTSTFSKISKVFLVLNQFFLQIRAFFPCSILWRTFWQFENYICWFLSVTFCILSLVCVFCIADNISVSNQGFEFAFTLTFLIGATKSIAFLNVFTKSANPAFTQVFLKQSGK